MEKLKYVTFHKQFGHDTAIIIQLTGGGASCTFKNGMSYIKVCKNLRELADHLERGVTERASPK